MKNKYSLQAKVIEVTCKKYTIDFSNNIILQHGNKNKLLFDPKYFVNKVIHSVFVKSSVKLGICTFQSIN